MWHTRYAALILLLLCAVPLSAKSKADKVQRESLQSYIERMQQPPMNAAPSTSGSLWSDTGRLANIASDYKASHLGDLITIVVSQNLTAQNSGDVSTNRTLSASSGITALAGQLKTAGVEQLFSPNSAQALTGKSEASTSSSLVTNLAGRVVAVMPSGLLVVEAEREITMNNERQTLLVRGLVRPGDIGPNNQVSSNLIGNLELDLKGKGVLSDGTRPPNFLVRMLLRIVGF
jgi:flagellar L-ring protein FlgH